MFEPLQASQEEALKSKVTTKMRQDPHKRENADTEVEVLQLPLQLKKSKAERAKAERELLQTIMERDRSKAKTEPVQLAPRKWHGWYSNNAREL